MRANHLKLFLFGICFLYQLKITNSKLQIPNKSQVPISNGPNALNQNIGHWDFGNYLDSGAWNLVIVTVVNNCVCEADTDISNKVKGSH